MKIGLRWFLLTAFSTNRSMWRQAFNGALCHVPLIRATGEKTWNNVSEMLAVGTFHFRNLAKVQKGHKFPPPQVAAWSKRAPLQKDPIYIYTYIDSALVYKREIQHPAEQYRVSTASLWSEKGHSAKHKNRKTTVPITTTKDLSTTFLSQFWLFVACWVV